MKFVEVVAAIIFFEEKFLCVQRNKNKFEYISEKWEFPGGKIEFGETKKEALLREIYEELELEITVGDKFLKVSHPYPDFHLTMHSYICHAQSDKIKLTEHIDHQWLTKDSLGDLDWAAADIPISEKLQFAYL